MATRKEEVEFLRQVCAERGWTFLPSFQASHPYGCRKFVAVWVPHKPYDAHHKAIEFFRQNGPGFPTTEEHVEGSVLFWQHLEMPSRLIEEK